MRALLVGAVEGTRVAAQAIAGCQGWNLCGILTLPLDRAGRHSDFVDLAPAAAESGAELIRLASSNSPEACKRVASLAPDFTFVIGWSQICGNPFREAVGGNVIGYHPAPLPRLRGRATIPWTILLDEKISASTLFWIDDGVDSGDILAQRFFHIAPRETAATLYARHMEALAGALGEILPRLAAGELPRAVQNPDVATYATRRRAEDGQIDWSRSLAEVDRLVRAVGKPYPGAFTRIGDRSYTIWSGEPTCGSTMHAIPGQVVAIEGSGFSVACGCGNVLRVTEFSADPPDSIPAIHAVLGRRS